ncbi:hypothetical protein ACFQX9_23445 [Bradyrhizobium sp. GCM10028915]|uniref:hypothetical protein n=1 Tax=Bradyrhizobium sp. GCM10028915 TaxID=3273385 RepID=UPI0036074777
MSRAIRIPGEGGKIEARAARLRAAVAAELTRVEEQKKPKPQKPAQKTFAHIRHYSDHSASRGWK